MRPRPNHSAKDRDTGFSSSWPQANLWYPAHAWRKASTTACWRSFCWAGRREAGRGDASEGPRSTSGGQEAVLQDRRSEPRPLPSCPRDPQGRGHSAGKGSRGHRTSAAACAIWAWGRNVGRVPGTGHLISQCPPPAPSAPGASTGDAIGYQHRQGREEPSHGALSRPRAHGRPCGGRVWPQLPLHVFQATRVDTHSHAPIPDATRGQATQRSQGASPAGPHPPGPEAGIPRGRPQLSARGHHEGQLCAHRPRTQDPAPRTPAQKRASSGVCLPWLQCSAQAARPPRSHCRHQSSKGPTRGPGPAGCPRESGTGHGGGSHPLARCSSVPPRPQRPKAQERPRGPGASSPGSCGILAACGEGLGVPSAFLKGSRVPCSGSVAAPLQLEGTDEEGRSEPEHRHGALRFGSDPRWERHPQAAASRVSPPPRPGASPCFSEKSCPREGPGLPHSDPRPLLVPGSLRGAFPASAARPHPRGRRILPPVLGVALGGSHLQLGGSPAEMPLRPLRKHKSHA